MRVWEEAKVTRSILLVGQALFLRLGLRSGLWRWDLHSMLELTVIEIRRDHELRWG